MSDLAAAYGLGGVVAGVWWYTTTENTGSTRRERAIAAVVVGVVWLPALIILYALRALVWVRS